MGLHLYATQEGTTTEQFKFMSRQSACQGGGISAPKNYRCASGVHGPGDQITLNVSRDAAITPEDLTRRHVTRSLRRARVTLRRINVRELLANVARHAPAHVAKPDVVLDVLACRELLASVEDLASITA